MSDGYKYPGSVPDSFVLGTSLTAVSTGNYAPQPEESFEQWLSKNVREFPVTLELDTELYSWIAKIVTYWAVAEWIQLGTLATLLKIDRNEARIMFGARIGNSLSKIKQLIDIRDLSIPIDLDALSNTLTECEKARNLVAHGVWIFDPDTHEYCIENPSGEWTPPKERPISKRKYPQAFPVSIVWFTCTFADIKTSIRELQRLDTAVFLAERRNTLPDKGDTENV